MSQEKLLDYLAGIVYGDGSLYYYAKNREHFVYIYDESREFLQAIGEMVKNTLHLRYTIVRPRNNQNYYRLQLTRKWFFLEMRRRIHKLCRKPTLEFVRGFFEAEGSFIIDMKRGKIKVELANKDQEVIRKTSDLLLKYGIRVTVTRHRQRNMDAIYKANIRGRKNVDTLLRILKLIHPKFRFKLKYLKARAPALEWGCSPIKGEREMGLDRRETGRTLPTGGVGRLRGRSA